MTTNIKIIALSILSLLLIIFFISKTYNYFGKYREEIALNIFNYKNYKSTATNQYDVEYYNNNLKKNIPLKLRDYYITASNKSYLATSSSNSVPSIKALKEVIKKGARFIHLDVYSDSSIFDPKATPIVRDRTLLPKYGKSIKLDDCLEIIASNGWKKTSAPLLLYLETHFYKVDKVMVKKVVKLLNKHFSKRYVDKSYGYKDSNIGNIDISDTKDKIIIFTNDYEYLGDLDEYINGIIPSYKDKNSNNSDNYTMPENEVNPGSISTTDFDKLSNNSSLINVYDYFSDMNDYGGISSKYSNTNDIIEKSRKSLSLVRPIIKYDDETLYNPVADMFNIDPTTSFNSGIQLVCMNYQYYDENMKKYLNFFKDGSLKIKPEKLRDIPKPEKKEVDDKQLVITKETVNIPGSKKTFNI